METGTAVAMATGTDMQPASHRQQFYKLPWQHAGIHGDSESIGNTRWQAANINKATVNNPLCVNVC